MSNTKPKSHYKITITSNVEKDMVKVQFSPKLNEETKREDIQRFLSTLFAGTHVGLHSLLADMNIMRPATSLERDAQVYIFKDTEKDNTLYKQRKQLHDGLAETFNNILKDLFPDIEYINMTIQHQQELAFNMSPEEAEEHQKYIEGIADKVKAMKDDEEDIPANLNGNSEVPIEEPATDPKIIPFKKEECL